MINPLLMGSVLAFQFPQSRAGLDWAVTVRLGVPTLDSWDAVAMGRAAPTQDELTAWESTYLNSTNTANRATVDRDLRVLQSLNNKLRINGVSPEAAAVRLLRDIVTNTPVASRTTLMSSFLTLINQAISENP